MVKQNLAKRAVACKHWKWLPGILTLTGYRVCFDGCTWPHLQQGDTLQSGLHLPDVTDPATRGCLLVLVREAWGIRKMVAIPQPDGEWLVWGLGSVASGKTEAEALVAALEAAP